MSECIVCGRESDQQAVMLSRGKEVVYPLCYDPWCRRKLQKPSKSLRDKMAKNQERTYEGTGTQNRT